MLLNKNNHGYFFFLFLSSLVWFHSNSYGACTSTNMTVNVIEKTTHVQPGTHRSVSADEGFQIRSCDKNGIIMSFPNGDWELGINISGIVYSLSGQSILKIAPSSLTESVYKLDISELLPGAYIVKISLGSSKSYMGNFLVSK